ncbi:MAG: stage II sporulation protein R [Clostridia bacterium]|nr:stage II sporulation protein R [Clostridia bacterium]
MKKTLGFVMAALLLIAAYMILPVHGERGLYDNVVRLHVLAESDSQRDQSLKLTVRDAVLEKTQPLLENVTTRDGAEAVLQAAIPDIQAAAETALTEAGAPNAVTVTLGQERYPTREYEQLAFPAGEYLSLRVMIGRAEGQNWWCVLFPPLCLTAATDARETEATCLAAGLTGEQYRMIADTDSTKYKLRFKILEVAEEMFG